MVWFVPEFDTGHFARLIDALGIHSGAPLEKEGIREPREGMAQPC